MLPATLPTLNLLSLTVNNKDSLLNSTFISEPKFSRIVTKNVNVFGSRDFEGDSRSSAKVVVLCMIWQESCHHYSSVHTLYLRRVSSALIHSYLKKNTNSSLCVVSKWLFWWLNFSNTNIKWIKWNHRNVVYVRLGYCAPQELKLQYEKLDLLLFINLGKKIFF